ncbi:RNA polymerase sigma factor [Acetobacterium malicum]|uniref:RNA polymerase sigma factor n=1 Tax=Acetobacterium malicum TaxID=52692 RepID=UPI0035942FE3
MSINENQNQPKNKDFFNGVWHLTVNDQVIEVTEEVYRAIKRPSWTERKRKEREKRCIVSNDRDRTKRCTEDCSQCDNQRTGSVLSLDKFIDDGFEVANAVDVAGLIEDKLRLEELCAALNELDPDNRRILELFYTGKSEREIADNIGLSQKAVNKRKTKIFAQLRDQLKNWA